MAMAGPGAPHARRTRKVMRTLHLRPAAYNVEWYTYRRFNVHSGERLARRFIIYCEYINLMRIVIGTSAPLERASNVHRRWACKSEYSWEKLVCVSCAYIYAMYWWMYASDVTLRERGEKRAVCRERIMSNTKINVGSWIECDKNK